MSRATSSSTRPRVGAGVLRQVGQAFAAVRTAVWTSSRSAERRLPSTWLTAAGLLRRTVQGRQVYFQANREAPIFPELQGLFAKTAGLTDELREARR